MSATEASRKFSDLLDAIEQRETITITRGNRAVAESVRRVAGPVETSGWRWRRSHHRTNRLRRTSPRSSPTSPLTGTTHGPTPDSGHNALISYERGTIDRNALDDDELAVAAVSIAEYRVGIELSDTAARAAD
jgi:antitoxin (DNA-binding transcriptional repressor) of toxin-antitoxin stability system